MARACKIYLVMGSSGPVAAFTVKHELASWLEDHPRNAKPTWRVYSIPDGKKSYDHRKIELLNREDLL